MEGYSNSKVGKNWNFMDLNLIVILTQTIKDLQKRIQDNFPDLFELTIQSLTWWGFVKMAKFQIYISHKTFEYLPRNKILFWILWRTKCKDTTI